MLVPFVGAREAQCPPLKDPGTLAHELGVSSERRKAPFPSPSPECPWAQGVESIPMTDVGEVVLCPRLRGCDPSQPVPASIRATVTADHQGRLTFPAPRGGNAQRGSASSSVQSQ